MSYFGKNIKKIRTVKRLSQSAFSDLFELSRAAIGAYEEGRAEPRIETVITIAKYFGISTDSLLTKELTINAIYQYDFFKHNRPPETDSKKSEVTHSRHFIPLVYIHKTTDYIAHCRSKRFIESLPTVYFPVPTTLVVRAFEHSSNEMVYEGCGLHHGDILICKSLKKNAFEKICLNKIHVCVLDEEIVVRRITANGSHLTLAADNPAFGNREIDTQQVVEIWEVVAVYTTLLPPVRSQ